MSDAKKKKRPRISQKRTDRKKAWNKAQSEALQITLAQWFAEGLVIPPGYVVDHAVPKEWCFNHEKSPERTASRRNLQIVTADYNLEKGTRLYPESFEVIAFWEAEDENEVE